MLLLEGCDSCGSPPHPTPCTWVTAKIFPALSITVPDGQESKEFVPALARGRQIQSDGLTKNPDSSRMHSQHMSLGFGLAKDNFTF